MLGSILLDGAQFEIIAGSLSEDDFALKAHQCIWHRLSDLSRRGGGIDRLTLTNELQRHNELESCGGLSYLVGLDDGLPRIPQLDSYVRIIQEKAVLRRTVLAAQTLIDRCVEAHDDSREILADAATFLAKLADRRGEHGEWMKPGEVMLAHPGGLNGFLQPTRGGTGIPTPWPGLTAALCGLHRGDLVLVAGRPGMGKSIIGMALAHHAATLGEGAAVISLEMSKESLVRRLVSAVGEVDAQRLRTGCLDREERARAAQAASKIAEIPLWIDDSRPRTVPAVTGALRKLAAREPVRVLVIDHIQLMRGAGRFENRHHELSEISHALKHLAGQFNLTTILLCQLSRECERAGRRPQLADLKETGSLEEDADVVLFVHRPEQYNRQDPSLRGQAEFITAKHRNGPVGKSVMRFEPEFQRFVELSDREDADDHGLGARKDREVRQPRLIRESGSSTLSCANTRSVPTASTWT